MKAFKSINLFRLPEDHGLSLVCIEADLFTKQFTPCGPNDMETRGFVPPAPHMPDLIAYVNQGSVLVHLQTETKVIPKQVIDQELKEKIAEIEGAECRKVGRKEAKDLREIVHQSLVCKAFTKITTQRAIIDLQTGLVMIEASSTGKAEDVLCVLREALGGLNTNMLSTNSSASFEMTSAIESEGALGEFGFMPGNDCELKLPEEDGSVAKFLRQDLYAKEVSEHLARGMLVTKLALEWNEKISFQLTENLEIKRVKFMAILQDNLKNMDVETQDAMFESSAALFIGEIRLMVADLIDALGGEIDL